MKRILTVIMLAALVLLCACKKVPDDNGGTADVQGMDKAPVTAAPAEEVMSYENQGITVRVERTKLDEKGTRYYDTLTVEGIDEKAAKLINGTIAKATLLENAAGNPRHNTCSLKRCDKKVISVAVNAFSFGDELFDRYNTYNFDASTGELITYDTLLSSQKDGRAKLEQTLRAEYTAVYGPQYLGKEYGEDYNNGKKSIFVSNTENSWYFTENGLGFYCGNAGNPVSTQLEASIEYADFPTDISGYFDVN